MSNVQEKRRKEFVFKLFMNNYELLKLTCFGPFSASVLAPSTVFRAILKSVITTRNGLVFLCYEM